MPEHLRIPPLPFEHGRHQDEAFDHLWVLYRGSQPDAAAEREAHDRGSLEAQAADQRLDIVCHRLEAHGPIGGRRAPVRLEVDPDDLTPGGEEFHVGSEHLDRPEAAVQEDERLALPDDLVTELDPVDAGNAGRVRRHRHILDPGCGDDLGTGPVEWFPEPAAVLCLDLEAGVSEEARHCSLPPEG